jgi:DNA polymerase V
LSRQSFTSRNAMIFALVDCNNFYCSCERAFQPRLDRVPVLVLSNNDGCAVARSAEVKALGIKMGDPEFQIRHLIKRHGIRVFSSNYTLYGDMSRRVMDTLDAFGDLEVYSIDEAFLDVSPVAVGSRADFCRNVRATVKQHTGIPTSIGIANTKTLAKLANKVWT